MASLGRKTKGFYGLEEKNEGDSLSHENRESGHIAQKQQNKGAIFIKYKAQRVYCRKKKHEDYVKGYSYTFKGDL